MRGEEEEEEVEEGVLEREVEVQLMKSLLEEVSVIAEEEDEEEQESEEELGYLGGYAREVRRHQEQNGGSEQWCEEGQDEDPRRQTDSPFTSRTSSRRYPPSSPSSHTSSDSISSDSDLEDSQTMERNHLHVAPSWSLMLMYALISAGTFMLPSSGSSASHAHQFQAGVISSPPPKAQAALVPGAAVRQNVAEVGNVERPSTVDEPKNEGRESLSIKMRETLKEGTASALENVRNLWAAFVSNSSHLDANECSEGKEERRGLLRLLTAQIDHELKDPPIPSSREGKDNIRVQNNVWIHEDGVSHWHGTLRVPYGAASRHYSACSAEDFVHNFLMPRLPRLEDHNRPTLKNAVNTVAAASGAFELRHHMAPEAPLSMPLREPAASQLAARYEESLVVHESPEEVGHSADFPRESLPVERKTKCSQLQISSNHLLPNLTGTFEKAQQQQQQDGVWRRSGKDGGSQIYRWGAWWVIDTDTDPANGVAGYISAEASQDFPPSSSLEAGYWLVDSHLSTWHAAPDFVCECTAYILVEEAGTAQ
jgi:hypothetical protein